MKGYDSNYHDHNNLIDHLDITEGLKDMLGNNKRSGLLIWQYNPVPARFEHVMLLVAVGGSG